MSFSSLDFIAFAIVVVGIYHVLPHRGQNLWLLAASLFFYGYIHHWYLALLFASAIASYLGAIAIERWPRYRRAALIAALVICFGILGAFKYFDFFVSSVAQALNAVGLGTSIHLLNVALPVGISFYTFQAASYVIDVYRGDTYARYDFADFLLFKAFFPQLVAGPIERAENLLAQVENKRVITAEILYLGVSLLVWGFFKKLVIADNVSPVADKIFGLNDPSFVLLIVGVFAFAIQILADFSGYTDIARGISALMGFRLVRNFNHPYFATSPVDFWRRWHISLSQWFRDYVYVPLGGSRATFPRQIGNLMLTFVLSGLWHGASWNFVLWGAYHGALVSIQHALERSVPWLRGEWPAWTYLPRMALTFALVCFGWLLFREADIHQIGRDLALPPLQATPSDVEAATYLFTLVLIYSLPLWIHGAFDLFVARWAAPLLVTTAARLAFPLLLGALFATTRALGTLGQSSFIYFQF